MIELLAQASQPADQTWVWSGIDVPQLLEHVALVAGLAAVAGTAVVIAAFKVLNVIIEQIGGSKKLWKEKVEGRLDELSSNQRDIAKVVSQNIPSTPEAVAKVDSLAAAPPVPSVEQIADAMNKQP